MGRRISPGVCNPLPSLAVLLVVCASSTADEQQFGFDFETGDLQGWHVVTGYFDKPLTEIDRYYHASGSKKQGRYFFSTTAQKVPWGNDQMTGVAESPVFVLTGPRMSLLVGGGNHADTYLALCTLDGRQVLQTRPEKAGAIERVEWNTPELVGKRVFLRIVDYNTGGWGHCVFDDFTAQGHVDPAATHARRIQRQFKQLDFDALRQAIDDLSRSCPDRYAQGPEFLSRFERLQSDAAVATDVDQLQRLIDQFQELQREALLANPLVRRWPILFVVRHQYRSSYHSVDTLFHTGEANTSRFQGPGAVKVLDLTSNEKVTTLLDMPDGVARDPDVHFSGRRIVFALRRHINEDYHIWEMNADGTGLEQLTSAEGVCDFDPIYLPDDTIVFSSTREPKYNQCSQDIGANLFHMQADGANIRQIGKNNLFDAQPSLLPDGRILYARWEYVDRNFGDAHCLWTVNPDGTNQAVYWGNNMASPGGVFDGHLVPGTEQVVCVFGPHHDRLWGALALIDRRRAMDGRPAVIRTWPSEAIERVRSGGRFDCDEFTLVCPKYEDPWPLSDKYFLCSRTTGNPDDDELMGIYLVDVFGNEVLVHVEGPGCYDPMPLATRPRPPVLPRRREFEKREGSFYVADVYSGTHMEGVERGSIKWLRVVEVPEKRFWSSGRWNGQGYTAPGMNWHSLESKRILGTVPVEQDGSAYFVVPAETFVYFQLLDEQGMMVQSMRSGASVQPNERIGCVGCHDKRRTAPPPIATEISLAMKRPASRLQEWYGPPRSFSYMVEVQPVLDKHCVGCHDYGKPAGEKLNLAPDRTTTFNTAYNELWRKKYVQCIGGGPAEVQPAYSWGSRASRLVQVLQDPDFPGHEELKPSSEDMDRIVTWIDINGVYYPEYACAYPDSFTGRCPLDNQQIERLSELTGVTLRRLSHYRTNRGPQVSFDRPHLSPCLSRLDGPNDPRHRDALAIIESGRRHLQQRPRADMPGFQPCEKDQQRQEKYAERRRIELRNRQAIHEGRLVHDR